MTILGDVGCGHVLGRYELLMPIASGGMAAVWAARLRGSRGFQKIVAVKTILPQLVDDPRFDQMFLDEASLASRIRHPHIVEILDLGEQDGVLYLVMEWVDGEAVSTVLRTAGKSPSGVPIPIAVRIVSQACAGLHAAHELRDESGELLGLVHRDVSPQNLLIAFDGVVKVVDFGVAKATQRASGNTNAGQVKGKAAYMSPEQAEGRAIDRRTDIFALGIVLYVLTTGRHPFRADNENATIRNICAPTPVDAPSQHALDYPLALEHVVMKALSKDPAQRFATAHDMLRALNQALPESRRVMTDDLVAEYMRTLFAGRQAQRTSDLRMALRTSDERAGDRGAIGLSLPVDHPSQLTLTSHTGITKAPPTSVDLHPAGRGAGAMGIGAPASVSGTTAPAIAQADLEPGACEVQRRTRRGRAYALVAVTGVVAVAATVALVVRSIGPVSRAPTPSTVSHATNTAPFIAAFASSSASLASPATSETSETSEASKAGETSETTPADAPDAAGFVASPSAASPADASTAEAAASNSASGPGPAPAVRVRTSVRQPGPRASWGGSKTPSPSVTEPALSSTTFIPPVRSPGF